MAVVEIILKHYHRFFLRTVSGEDGFVMTIRKVLSTQEDTAMVKIAMVNSQLTRISFHLHNGQTIRRLGLVQVPKCY